MRLSWASTAAAIVGIVTVACSGSTSSSNVSPTQACNDLGNAICSKIESCAPFELQVVYGSTSACATRFALTCPDAIAASGSGATPAAVESCSQAYSSASCGDVLSGKTPSACQIYGTLTAGTVCGADQQCVGPDGYCKVAATAVCGACGTTAAAGGACSANSDCQSGLTCPLPTGSTTGSCVAPGAAGATCDKLHPCASPLACLNTTCSQPVEAGQACDATAQNCDFTQGLFCNPTTKVCAQIGMAGAGAPCGFANGAYTVCNGGGTCNLNPTTGAGTCEAVAADGATCGSNGASCLQPAVCVNNTCTIPNASSCH